MTQIRAIALPLALSIACASPGKGLEDDPNPSLDSKSDSFQNPTPHGNLPFGVRQQAELTEDARFHTWTFQLDDDAEVEIATDAVTANLDTVMYMYRRDPGDEQWGSFIHKNDDDGDAITSRLAVDLQAGEYRILIKGFKTSLRGRFGVSAECSGAGCPAENTVCELDSVEPMPGFFSQSCGDAISDALDGVVIGNGNADVTIEERCALEPTISLAVDYYVSYFGTIEDFEEFFDFGGGASADFDWTELDNGSFLVGVDGGGDEAGMTFLIDPSGQVVFHYQHNQSPDYTLYCDGGSEFRADTDCGSMLLRAMPHEASDEVLGDVTVTVDDLAIELDGAALAAADVYSQDRALPGSEVLDVTFEQWTYERSFGDDYSVGRVWVSQGGADEVGYELAIRPDDGYLFTIDEGGARAYACTDL